MAILTTFTDSNLVTHEGFKHAETSRIVNLLLWSSGIGSQNMPIWVKDTVYTGSYSWVGVTKEQAIAKAQALYDADDTDGTGKNGLKKEIDVYEISGDPATITSHKEVILIGTAEARPMRGNLWEVVVNIDYTLTTFENVVT